MGGWVMIGDVQVALRRFGARGWLLAAVACLATLLTIGVPAAIIETPLFIRMTPVRAQDYAIWSSTRPR